MTKTFRGSQDTGAKLDQVRQYLQQYSIALQKQSFSRVYVDAFAGSGVRTETRAALPLFEGAEAQAQEVSTPGSARIALSIEPAFDIVALIERDKDRYAELKALKTEFPTREIILKNGDANSYVRQICQAWPWHRETGSIRGMRGVIFLDPFGMEVEWATVEAIAATRALDCWYFFPLSGLYRNAPHNPAKLDPGKERSLDRVLGATDWRERWYDHSVVATDLFEDEIQATRRADIEAIERYVGERLKGVFKGTVLQPFRLRHNNNAPMASLFFAVSNPSKAAVELATNIAGYILTRGNSSQVRSR